MQQNTDSTYTLKCGKVITGTLVWYYFICKREVWLMGHEITPDEDSPLLDFGRAIHEVFYDDLPKERIMLEGIKFDLVKRKGRIVCEIKTSSKFIEAAKFQLLYYLYRLRELGVDSRGEILIPKERRRIQVLLDKENEGELLKALKDIKEILEKDVPPLPRRIPFCRKCAYKEFCWA